jgi:hypothetical protein
MVQLSNERVGCLYVHTAPSLLLLQFLELGIIPSVQQSKPISLQGSQNIFRGHEVIAVHDAAATSDVTSLVTLQGLPKKHDSPPGWPTEGTTVHTLCTSNGSPYTNFQNRIMYATYKMVQKQGGGENMVAFTRILHRTVEDELMKV